MSSPSSTPPVAPNPRPPFTTLSRVLCVLALTATAGVMYWVLQDDNLDSTHKLLAVSSVLTAGVLVIAAGAHFSDGRHRK